MRSIFPARIKSSQCQWSTKLWAVPTGLPLPALTLPTLMSQLAFRVFGPHLPAVHSVLDHLGLLDQPATKSTRHLTDRHHVSGTTIRNRVRKLETAGQKLPIPDALVREATRPSQSADDDLGRQRVAKVPGLQVITTEQVITQAPPAVRSQLTTAGQLLAAVGPLPWPELHAAVLRQRTRISPAEAAATETDLQNTLANTGIAISGLNDIWYLTTEVPVPHSWAKIRDALVPDRTYRAAELFSILTDLGYARSTATSRTSGHPLIRIAAEQPRRYALLSTSKFP